MFLNQTYNWHIPKFYFLICFLNIYNENDNSDLTPFHDNKWITYR